MHDMLKKLIEKKKEKGEKMSPDYKEAKGSVLKGLMEEMDGMASEPIKGLKKVTVAAKDEDGLKEGLKKAEEVIKEMPMDESSEDEAEEADESAEEEADEHHLESMSLEELDELAKKIEEAKKAKL